MEEKNIIWGNLLFSLILITMIHRWITRKPCVKVYLVDFACHKPPHSQTISKAESLARAKWHWKNLKPETLDFFITTIERGGLGDSTYLPEGFLSDPVDLSMAAARREVEQVLFGTVDSLLTKTKIKCDDIGILVVNCCAFNPIPSISTMIVNRYKLKDDICSYSLSGMGCSASLRAIELAKQLLQVHPNSSALVVSTESLTQHTYSGNDRSKFLINSLFRVGGAAMLLSNRPPNDRRHLPKYELVQTVHTHMAGSSDSSYKCIYMDEDDEGHVGVSVGKDLLGVGAKAIRTNITSLARLILPIREQLRYLVGGCRSEPDLKIAFEHFLPHVGGKPLLDELQKSLGISEEGMEASRMTLYRYGNVSSSSVWYAFAYAEAKGRVKKGDRVWQIAFGSGFKCSSVVWRALRSVGLEDDEMLVNPWNDEIEAFPVETKDVGSFSFYLRPPDEFIEA